MRRSVMFGGFCAAIMLAACLAPGCREQPFEPFEPPVTLQLRRVSVEPNPHNVVSAVVRVLVSGASTVTVAYGTDSLNLQGTPHYPVRHDSVTIPVLGLRPATNYLIRVIAVSSASGLTHGYTGVFTTGALPADLPAFRRTLNANPSPGYVMLGFTAPSAMRSYAVIIDNAANVVFYRAFTGPVFDFQSHADGSYTAWGRISDEDQHFYRMDRLGNILQEYRSTVMSGTGPHEFRQEGTAFAYFGMEFREMDLTAIGGLANAMVRGMSVEYFRPPASAFLWSTFDHLAVTDAAPDIDLTGPTVNPWHGNAIDIDTDGNLLVSFRNMDEVTKISTTTGDIIWRMGGRRNQFTFLNDPLNGFSHQHGVRRLAGGTILLFDNGNLHTPPQSRAVEYALDESARTATMVWEYRPEPPLFGSALGFAQRLANGNTLICFGQARRIIEVTPGGVPQWEITIDDPDRPVYRAFRIASLY